VRSPTRAALHRFRVILNPLLWIMAGAAPEHRAGFLNAVDLATTELEEPDAAERHKEGDEANP
jgi:hypothetical protein